MAINDSYTAVPRACTQTRHGFRYGAGYKLRSRYCVSTDLCVVRIQTARLDVIYRTRNKISHVTYPIDYTIRRDPRRYRDVQLRPFPSTIYVQPIHQSAPCSIRGSRTRNRSPRTVIDTASRRDSSIYRSSISRHNQGNIEIAPPIALRLYSYFVRNSAVRVYAPTINKNWYKCEEFSLDI